MDILGIAPRTTTGKTFRVGLWGWRCIHEVCENLKVVDTDGWEVNVGHGCKSQGECDRLADAIEIFLLMVDNPTATSNEKLPDFVLFLRECGGFAIC